MDFLIIRLVTKTNENYQSLESSCLDYIMKLNEHLDIQEYVEDHLNKKQEVINKSVKR